MELLKKFEKHKKSFVKSVSYSLLPMAFCMLFTFLILPAFLISKPANAAIYIDINSPTIKKISIAVPDFNVASFNTSSKGISKTSPSVISSDLDFSGFFKVLDPKSFLDKPEAITSSNVNYSNWATVGAEALVKGEVRKSYGTTVTLNVKVYDITTAKQIFEKNYTGDGKDSNYLAHLAANDIQELFTGIKGIFDTQIAFISKAGKNKEVYISDYDGSNIKKITFHNSLSLFPKWSSDGRTISFTSYKGGNQGLYVKDVFLGAEKVLSNKRGLNLNGNWSFDGKKLAFTTTIDGNAEIYVINKDGSGLKRLTKSIGSDISPTWSPDGSEIAFVSDRGGSPQIYIMSSNGDNVRRLTYEGKYNTSPSWSPKGDKIAYVSQTGGRRFDIFAITADGKAVQKITNGGAANENPSWSPDGRYIIFNSNRNGGHSIYIMKSDRTEVRKIFKGKGEFIQPSWSPRIAGKNIKIN